MPGFMEMWSWADAETWLTALKGKVVVGIDVATEDEALRFRCEDGSSVVWQTVGDCCSESWWADGYQLGALRGAAVQRAEAIDMPQYNVEDGRGRQEVDEVYGIRIDTDKGSCTLAFRNSSNGYYGGWAELGEDNGKYVWQEITTDDWQAGAPNLNDDDE